MGWVMRRRPVGSTQATTPSGRAVTVQPGRCLMRWCRRHRQMRLLGWVGPAGQGLTWSRSQDRAVTEHPGKRQPPSRALTKSIIQAGGR